MSEETDGRPLRADARRNRELILQAALAELTEKAPDKPLSLDAVASRAGVGPGTLYRRFATREALVEALYHRELERLCYSVDELLDEYPPDRALRVWMGRYADFVAAKRGMMEVLRGLVAAGAPTATTTRSLLTAAAERLLSAGGEQGLLRRGIAADDVVAAMAGSLMTAGGTEPREQADRLLDILLDGLRAPRD